MQQVLKHHKFEDLLLNAEVTSVATKRKGRIKFLRKQDTHPTYPRHNEIEIVWNDNSPNTRVYHKDCETIAYAPQ